jgi:large subunit ribosomal protein L22
MSQTANPRRLPETQALARAKMIRTSAQKLNVVAAMIRGKSASAALASLVFCERRVAHEVKKVLQAAIANTRGRGKSARIEKPFSNLTVIVAERAEVVTEGKA